MGFLLSLLWPGGIVVSIASMRVRAGLGFWHGLRPSDVASVVWLVKAAICSVFWPVTLVVWLARGRPQPSVVYERTPAGFRRRA
ncbi:hypothetical protein [Frankia sp. QA3]|uniref:hypothetical protein n=1 Tax=Frankia sp. QA3 TaxID=710111 RepID=UPI0002ED0293|nr:hypothetical protein [Frankia sp. QA3]